MKTRRRRCGRFELAHAMRVAARNIENPTFRAIAGREADAIVQLLPERLNRGWGVVASHGRSLMRRLATMADSEFEDAATTLRQCADVVQHGATTVSETNLTDKRRAMRQMRRA